MFFLVNYLTFTQFLYTTKYIIETKCFKNKTFTLMYNIYALLYILYILTPKESNVNKSYM